MHASLERVLLALLLALVSLELLIGERDPTPRQWAGVLCVTALQCMAMWPGGRR